MSDPERTGANGERSYKANMPPRWGLRSIHTSDL